MLFTKHCYTNVSDLTVWATICTSIAFTLLNKNSFCSVFVCKEVC